MKPSSRKGCLASLPQSATNLSWKTGGERTCLGLARTVYIRRVYGFYGREITKYTVIYGVCIRFWPTLHMVQTLLALALIRAAMNLSRKNQGKCEKKLLVESTHGLEEEFEIALCSKLCIH